MGGQITVIVSAKSARDLIPALTSSYDPSGSLRMPARGSSSVLVEFLSLLAELAGLYKKQVNRL